MKCWFHDLEGYHMSDQSSGFNLKMVLQQTGLNAELLRAWERRYGLPKPERTPGRHRIYTLRDIHMLNWLTARQSDGMSISRAIKLWRDLESSGQDPLAAIPSLGQSIGAGVEMVTELRQAWVSAFLNFDEQTAEHILALAFALYAPELVCFDLLLKGLSIIGNRWYLGETSIQQEHFASALAMRRLHILAAAAPAPNRPGRILAACPPGEEHEFSLLLLTVILRRRGWEVVYLGVNVPIIRLESALAATNPYLVVSVSQTLPSAASLRQMGEFLAAQNVRLAYGGGIFNGQTSIKNFIPGYYLGNELPEAMFMVENIWNLKLPIQQIHPIPPDYVQALKDFNDYHPHIEIYVNDAMRGEGIAPAYLDIAINALRQHLVAALSLGDIHLLGDSLKWLTGLLVNQNLPIKLLKHFLEHYQQAIAIYMPAADQVMFSELNMFNSSF
jgi:DNA-binding transcriptional MerR regulator